ncbi:hypothetical protein D9M72_526770 [compost metagenome]
MPTAARGCREIRWAWGRSTRSSTASLRAGCRTSKRRVRRCLRRVRFRCRWAWARSRPSGRNACRWWEPSTTRSGWRTTSPALPGTSIGATSMPPRPTSAGTAVRNFPRARPTRSGTCIPRFRSCAATCRTGGPVASSAHARTAPSCARPHCVSRPPGSFHTASAWR